ncbi:MAG: phosphatase PAP2 family protein [Parvibaculaceae bacterium]
MAKFDGIAGLRRFPAELAAAARGHLMVYLGAAIIFATGWIASRLTGYSVSVSPEKFILKYILNAALFVIIGVVVIKLFRMVLVEKPASPLRAFGRWIAESVLDPRRLANGVHGSLFVFLLMGGFTLWKNQVPRIQGFAWDNTFAALDRTLFAGVPPQDLTQYLLGNPWITKLIDQNYVLWFPVLFASTLAVSFQPVRSFLRHRFMIALILAWGIGGVILANIFSSAGPVYFRKVAQGLDPYAAHFASLHTVDHMLGLEALSLQDTLWSTYARAQSFSSISAFPSMHVAIALLVFLACRHLSLGYRLASGAFAILIAIGSVHLGWHYAVDAYAGALIAVLSWWLANRVAIWDFARQGLPAH